MGLTNPARAVRASHGLKVWLPVFHTAFLQLFINIFRGPSRSFSDAVGSVGVIFLIAEDQKKYLVAYATLFDLLFSQADIDTSTFYIQ